MKMKFAKRQVILGALILALGAAVYLNWQFTTPSAIQTDSSTSQTSSQSEIKDEDLGIAQLVNNSYLETVQDEVNVPTTAQTQEDTQTMFETNTSDAISQARLSRQTTRDEAISLLEDVLEDVNADAQAKQTAVDESAKIAQVMLQESTAENLLNAKGISEAVVFVNGEDCTVVVSSVGENALIIQDIVTSQTGVLAENIQLIEVG